MGVMQSYGCIRFLGFLLSAISYTLFERVTRAIYEQVGYDFVRVRPGLVLLLSSLPPPLLSCAGRRSEDFIAG